MEDEFVPLIDILSGDGNLQESVYILGLDTDYVLSIDNDTTLRL